MKYLLMALGVSAGLAAGAYAQEVSSSDRGLVTAATPVPETATDSRDDGVLRDATNRPITHDLLGQTLFQFEAPLVGGGSFNSDSLRGRWTVMVFWGVWCHDSRNDAENIDAVAAHFAENKEVQFMSLHVPFKTEYIDRRFGDYGSVEAYFEAVELSWPTALDETSILRAEQKIQWTPTYLVIGPDMTVEAYRTDLSVAGEGAVTRFIDEVEAFVSSPQ